MGKKDFPWVPRQVVRLVCWLVFMLGHSRALAVLFRPLAAAVLRRYRHSLHGAFPGAVSKGVLFLSCDEAYYQEFGIHLVHSALKHAPEYNVHLHVNRLSESYRRELQRFADAQAAGLFSYTWDDLDFEHLSGARRWYYLASVRFVRLYQLVQACRAPVLSVDADGLVVKSLESKFAQMAERDAGIYLRLNNTLDWRKVLASALFIMPTELGQRYSRDVAVVIGWLLRGKLHYHIDQLVIYYLWDLYRRHQPGFRDAPLSQDMADWECGQESYIWSAKGERKYLDEQFLKARQE